MSKFKKGDKVRCTQDFYDGVVSHFTKNKIYTLRTDCDGLLYEMVYVESDDLGRHNGWSHEFFELVAPTPTLAPSSGTKYDDGKTDMSLLSPIAINKIAQVMTFGKKKYDAHNWRKGFGWSRVLAAALRHIFAYLSGEDKDPESGLSHLAHAGCCIMFLLEFEETHKELDDRYKPEVKP